MAVFICATWHSSPPNVAGVDARDDLAGVGARLWGAEVAGQGTRAAVAIMAGGAWHKYGWREGGGVKESGGVVGGSRIVTEELDAGKLEMG